jgi:hypothetical protein
VLCVKRQRLRQKQTNKNMSKLSKYLFIIMMLALLCVVGYRYYGYVYMKNFLIDVNAVCDPKRQSCFVADCDPADSECDTTPYIKVELLAHDAPVCLEEHSCQTFSCSGLSNCTITTCSSESLSDGEKCFETK